MLRIEVAKNEDLESIEQLFIDCKADLLQKGICQWDDNYPNKDYFTSCIEEKELCILRHDEKIVGAVVLNDYQVPEWQNVEWTKENGTYFVIHSLAIHPDYQSGGYGSKLLSFCEVYALDKNYDGIRLDAFSENNTALKFYEKHGYSKKGELIFSFKPEGHQRYFCYEKLFDK